MAPSVSVSEIDGFDCTLFDNGKFDLLLLLHVLFISIYTYVYPPWSL